MRLSILLLSILFLFQCSTDQKPEVENISLNTGKDAPDKKNVKKSTPSINDMKKNKPESYMKGLSRDLNLSTEERKLIVGIKKKYQKIKKTIPKGDKLAISKLNKNKNNEYLKILGTERMKQKAVYDKKFKNK